MITSKPHITVHACHRSKMETLDTWSISVASSESLERPRDTYTNYAGNGSSINTREDVPVSFVYLYARASNTQPSLKSNSTSSVGRNAIYSSDSFDEFLSSIGDAKETTGSRPLPHTASQLLLAEIVSEEAHCRDGRHEHESARDGGHGRSVASLGTGHTAQHGLATVPYSTPPRFSLHRAQTRMAHPASSCVGQLWKSKAHLFQ